LRTIAGVLDPDRGRVAVEGRVASLLSVDAGLMPTLTGRESCLLLCVLAGLSRRESRAAVGAVGELAGLGDAFERPVASYSQGMRARLGFAAAVQSGPTVLLLDEVHEALDHEFRAVVEELAAELLGKGGVVIAAGHDHPLLESLCNRALLLERGRVKADGAFEDVRAAYVG
jgi:ABC-type polysaccharide/polyol phosphate transport system ATPase subunit